MQLIYRGHVYNYTPAPVKPYQKPRALNWRYQSYNKYEQDTQVPIQPYKKPRALNWRYQISSVGI
ncbi:hypothetical protein ACE1CI_25395 [Aerosakkonemataceae cyanobacterium BLCC-F50]|uniref:DUF4278 domain-containing protein n=1 Tax=Floridaenema flaviceps BLCC-F50 TaxID=3153642 RepID=A0ABV4XWY8_9CYAN